MAKQDQTDGKGKGGKAKLIIVLTVLVLVLVGGAVAATLFLTGVLSPQARAVADASAPPRLSVPQSPAQYVSLDPPLILAFEYEGQTRFAQISLSAMARSEATIEAVEIHLPRIRNSLIMLFSTQSFESLETTAGKESVREQALQAVREILRAEARVADVEALYFTNFVMQ